MVLRLCYPDIVPMGFSTLIILILLIGGIQILTTSILGCYIAHIYDEVKRRPPFLVESILNRPTPAEQADAPRQPPSRSAA